MGGAATLRKTTRDLSGAGVNSATVERISQANDEPSWLRDQRSLAFASYESIPMPTLRDEEWRRTDVRGLHLDSIVPFSELDRAVASVADLDPAVRAEVQAADQTGGIVVVQDSGRVYASIADNLASRG